MILRPYQTDTVDAIVNSLADGRMNVVAALPTGSGKSAVIAALAEEASRTVGRVLIVSHVRELLEQVRDACVWFAPQLEREIGINSAGLNRRDTDHRIIIAGVQSVYAEACDLGRFALMLVDEAHTIPASDAGMYRRLIRDLRMINPDMRLVGLTATPYRLGTGLVYGPGQMFEHLVCDIPVSELIADGYLSPLVTNQDNSTCFSGVRTVAGEFVMSDVAALIDNETKIRAAVTHTLERAVGRRSGLLFSPTVAHAEHVAAELIARGETCRVVTGDTADADRAEAIAEFKAGRVRWLASVGVLTTGFDAPNVDCVVMFRPTQSPGLYSQICGRGLRICEGKTNCLVLDFAGNIERHGPIDAVMPPRRKIPRGQVGFYAKNCPDCGASHHVSIRVCRCGHVFAPRPETENKHDVVAADVGIMTGTFTDIEYVVSHMTYTSHRKKDGKPGHPPTLRVNYHCGLTFSPSDFICVEHPRGTYAHDRAKRWWSAMIEDPNVEMPATVTEALQLAHSGAFKRPSSIVIRKAVGDKYGKIISYRFGGTTARPNVPAPPPGFKRT